MSILSEVTQLVDGVDVVSAKDIMDTQETAISAIKKADEALDKANNMSGDSYDDTELRELINNKANLDASNLSTTNINSWKSVLGIVPSIKRLWSNSNPSANITTGTINLSSSDYDYLIITSLAATYNQDEKYTYVIPKGSNCVLKNMSNSGYYNTSGDSIFEAKRTLTYVNDTRYSIGGCTAVNWLSYSQHYERSGFNDTCIPLFILGVKL